MYSFCIQQYIIYPLVGAVILPSLLGGRFFFDYSNTLIQTEFFHQVKLAGENEKVLLELGKIRFTFFEERVEGLFRFLRYQHFSEQNALFFYLGINGGCLFTLH